MMAGDTVRLLDLQPGDGQRYRVLWGRLGGVERYLFGIAEGHDPIITVVLDAPSTPPALDYESGATYEGAHNTPAQMRAIATAVYAALIGVPGIPTPAGFRPGWAAQLDRSTGGGGQ